MVRAASGDGGSFFLGAFRLTIHGDDCVGAHHRAVDATGACVVNELNVPVPFHVQVVGKCKAMLRTRCDAQLATFTIICRYENRTARHEDDLSVE